MTRESTHLLIGALVALSASGCAGEPLCSNACTYAFDGECDDGGEGSLYALCGLGTDCVDCGVRGEEAAEDGTATCANTCEWAHDGECDDGGPGSDYAICALGTDCADCGVRRPGDEAEAPSSGGAGGSSGGGGSWDSGYDHCDLGDPLLICLCLSPGDYSLCWDI